MDTLAHARTVTNMRILAQTRTDLNKLKDGRHTNTLTQTSQMRTDTYLHTWTHIFCTDRDELYAVGFTHTWEQNYKHTTQTQSSELG